MNNLKESQMQQMSFTKAFVIYDDLSSFAKANVALQSFAQNPRSGVNWTIKPWMAALLRFPPTSDEALTQALDAQLIVFASRGDQSYPFWLQDWLARWARRRQIENAAFVVVSQRNTNRPASADGFTVEKFAKGHGLDVIAHIRGDQENKSLIIPGFPYKPQTPALPAQ